MIKSRSIHYYLADYIIILRECEIMFWIREIGCDAWIILSIIKGAKSLIDLSLGVLSINFLACDLTKEKKASMG